MEPGQFKAHHANRVYGSRLRRVPARDMTLADMTEKSLRRRYSDWVGIIGEMFREAGAFEKKK